MKLPVAIVIRHDVGVMSCGHGIEAEVDGLLEQRGELDALVAAHARVRRSVNGVLGDEVVDHICLEPLGEVPHVVGNADLVGHALRVHGVFDGAAASRTRTEGTGHSRQGEVHPDHVVSGLDRARRGNRGVDPPLIAAKTFTTRAYARPPTPCPICIRARSCLTS